MVIAFPRDLVLEAYMGRWVDITALAEGRALRQVEPVRITWGLPNEQSKALAPPSTVDAVLNNTGGHWTPGNPMSDYYDYLRARNVPMRLSLRTSRDTFSRTVPVDWGFSDTADGWGTATSGSGTASVGSGVGTHSQPNTGAYVVTYIEAYPDCQVRGSCLVNITNITGGSLEPLNLVQRFQPSGAFAGEHYLLRVEMTSAEVLNVTIYHSTLGPISSTVAVSGVIDAVSAKNLRAVFQMEGQTLRGKVYQRGPANDPDQFEPLGWQVSAHHERLTGGFPGIRSGVAGGNTNTKPILFDYDDWELRLVRHSGELTRSQPDWDVTHRIKKAIIKVAGVTQRLGRPQRPTLSSAPRRYFPGTAPLAYWPLDEAQYSDAVRPLVGDAPVSVVAPSEGQGALALNALAPWIGTGMTTVPDAIAIKCPVVSPSVTAWGTDLLYLPTLTAANATSAPHIVTTDSSIWQVFVDVAAGTIAMRLNPSGGAQVTLGTTGVLPSLFNGRVHHLRWRTAQNGSAVDWFVYLDGVLVLGGSRAAFTNTAMTQVRLFSNNQPCTFGHVAPFSGSGPDVVATSYACFGYPAERALTRAIRLSAEEGVPFDYWGDQMLTPPMGPQKPAPLLDLLTECAEADQAFIYEPRYTSGVAIRSRRSMVAQATPVATLSYSAGQVAPKTVPSADDRPSANLVRVERVDGAVIFIEQATGVMNIKDPGTDPQAIGKSPTDVRVNVEADAQLPHVGAWVRALGTTPEMRFPKIAVDLAAKELTTGADPTLPARQILQMGVGGRLLVTGLQAADVYFDLDQMVRGGVETYKNVRLHGVVFNTAPYEKWRTGVFGDGVTRFDTAGSTFVTSLTTTYTGTISLASVGSPWTTSGANFPLNVECEGEVITLSGISGATSPQTATISARSVNGVVKAHGAGASLRLATAYYHC